jgi:hypothetical protein
VEYARYEHETEILRERKFLLNLDFWMSSLIYTTFISLYITRLFESVYFYLLFMFYRHANCHSTYSCSFFQLP